jgi:hypothetical protein
MQIKYRKGSENQADALSRLPPPTAGPRSLPDPDLETTHYCDHILAST